MFYFILLSRIGSFNDKSRVFHNLIYWVSCLFPLEGATVVIQTLLKSRGFKLLLLLYIIHHVAIKNLYGESKVAFNVIGC